MLCPICLEFQLVEREELNDITYKGRYGKLTMEYSNCPQCGDQANPEQTKRNRIKTDSFKDTVDLWTNDMDNTNG